jgi:hypothetical protein
MKKSIRYRSIISQFIQTFIPPLKMGKGDDALSLETNESPTDESLMDPSKQKSTKRIKPRSRIGISSQQLKSILKPESSALENPQESQLQPQPQPKPKGRGKKSINVGSLVFPSSAAAAAAVASTAVPAAPLQPSEETDQPKKSSKPKGKKINVSSFKFPTFSAKAAAAAPSQMQQDTGLSNIEEIEQVSQGSEE